MESTKEIYEMNELRISPNTPNFFEYLFVSLNFIEERAWSAINELIKKKVQIGCLIVLDLYNQEEEIRDYLIERSDGCIKEYKFVKAKKQEHEKIFLMIKELVGEELLGRRIGIDISCIPTPQFFILLKWFAKLKNYIIVYYTEPQKYVLNGGLFKSYFSMKGPVTVQEIRGFSGVTVKNHEVERVMLCMLGFDNDLLPSVIQEAGPRKIVAINGFPSFYPKFKDISLVNNEKILSGSGFSEKLEKSKSLTNFIYVEADNPFESYNVLQELKKQYDDNCIDIVPLGTKPMALGVCMYAIENTDVRVVFPFPEEYAQATSEKSKKTLEYVLGVLEK